MSLLSSAKNILLGKTDAKASSSPNMLVPSVYWLTAFDGEAEFSSVRFRLAPNALSAQTPMRSQVTQDFDGNVSVLDGGPGVSRWTLSGQHGIGALDKASIGLSGGDSPGLKAMKELQEFFVDWSDENTKRRAAGTSPLRLQFSMLGGGPTELRNARWWIWPESFPTQKRSAQSPLGWDWDFSFFALETLDAIEPLPAIPPDAPKKLGLLDKLMKKCGLKPWDPKKGLLGNLQEMKRNVDKVRKTVNDGIKKVTKTTISFTGAIRGMVTAAQGILKDTRTEVKNVRTIVKSDAMVVRRAAIETRRLAGALKREMHASGRNV